MNVFKNIYKSNIGNKINNKNICKLLYWKEKYFLCYTMKDKKYS